MSISKVFNNDSLSYSYRKIIYGDIFERFIKSEKYEGCTFDGNVIANVTYVDCHFVKCRFKNTEFHNVNFLNCFFKKTQFNESMITFQAEKCEFMNVTFDSCTTLVDLYKVSRKDESDGLSIEKQIEYISKPFTIANSKIANMYFIECYLDDVLLRYNEYNFMYFNEECELDKVNITNPIKYFNIHFDEPNFPNMTVNIKFPEYKQIDKYLKEKYNYQDRCELNSQSDYYKEIEMFYKFYLEIGIYYREKHLNARYGEYYYISKKIERKKYKGLKGARFLITDLICGYGEKWYNGMITSIGIIIVCAFIYMFGLKVSGGYTIKYQIAQNFDQLLNIKWGIFFGDLWNCLYFSMMTFTTVGYGNMEAITPLTQMFSFMQMFVGVFLIAITTGSLLRKLFR